MIKINQIFCGEEQEVKSAISSVVESNLSVEEKATIYLKATWFFNQNALKNGDNHDWIQILKKIRTLLALTDPTEIREIANALQIQIKAEKSSKTQDYMECINNLIRVARVETAKAA